MNYLVIGDGNFSFSLALTKEHKSLLLQLVATSLENYDKVLAHDGAAENIRELIKSGATVLHGVDGTLLSNHNKLRSLEWKFDVIFFNFPHTGGKANIKQNRELLHNFFQSAVGFLTERGEIHLSLCKGQGGTPVDCTKRGYGNSWKVVEMAAEAGLILSSVEPFQPDSHPGYQPTGYRGQSKGFLLEGALTHVFSLSQVDPTLAPWRRVASVCEPCQQCFRSPPAEFPASLLDEFTAQLLHYPLLAQPWHPVSLVRQMLEEHLKRPNQLWQSATCQFREQILVHCSPSNCIPQEVAPQLQHSVGSLCEPPAATGVDAGAKCCQPQARLYCQSLVELEIPSLVRFFKQSAQDSASMLVLSTTPVIRNTPISLIPTDQPITHNMLGVFSLNSLMEGGCCLRDFLEGVLIETVHGVFTQSVLLAPRIQKTDLLWSDCNNSVCLKKSRQLHLKLIAGDSLIARYGTYQCSETPLLFAFIIYLEPIAMAHFGIDDARLLWSRDTRFASQFLMDNPQRASFHPFSIFPPTYSHDISFWNPRREDKDGATTATELDELQLANIVRRETQNSVVSVECTDVYQPPRSPSASYCYHLCYRAADTALSRSKASHMQLQLRGALQNDMKIELR